MERYGSFRPAAPVLAFLSIFIFTKFTLAASLHLRTTTDKDAYNVDDQVNWTIWAWASTGDNRGVKRIMVNLNDNRDEELEPALYTEAPSEFEGTEYGTDEGFIITGAGTKNPTPPRLSNIGVDQTTKILDIGNDGEEHIFAKGEYAVTQFGPHDLNASIVFGQYYPDEASSPELFTPGDNFPAQFNVVFDADVNGDMYINLGDLGQLGSGWLVTDCNTVNDWCGRADVNRSGEVDTNDISFMAGQWLWCSNPDDPDCDPYLPE